MTTVDSWPKTLRMPSAQSWNSTTETHLAYITNIVCTQYSYSYSYIFQPKERENTRKSFWSLSEIIQINRKRKVTLHEWTNWLVQDQIKLSQETQSALTIQQERKWLFSIHTFNLFVTYFHEFRIYLIIITKNDTL